MTTMDLLFLLILVLLFARTGRSIVMGRHAELPVRQPGKIVSNALLLIVFMGALYLRREGLSMPFMLLAGAIACIGADFFVKNGLGDEGLIYAGKVISYSDMRFVSIETENEKGLYARIHTERRDYGMQVAPADRDAFLARMAAAKLEVHFRSREGAAEGGTNDGKQS